MKINKLTAKEKSVLLFTGCKITHPEWTSGEYLYLDENDSRVRDQFGNRYPLFMEEFLSDDFVAYEGPEEDAWEEKLAEALVAANSAQTSFEFRRVILKTLTLVQELRKECRE